MLMPDDFKAYSKIKVDNHLFNKENLPSRFKFKEYCPMVFRNLRERFGIDDQDYQNSVTRSAPINSDSQGRCGTRFLTTYDRRFVIKTVSSEDVAEMHNILKKYHQFIVECHGNTLLPQFLGMYRLTVDGVETYMVVTRNVFSHRLTVHRKYDLKGSTVAREASDKEKAKDLPTFKDNDFLNEGQKLHVGEESKKNFLEKLKRDVEFLAQLKIMDYSLLVGIHDVDRAEQEEMEVEERAEDEECENDGLGGNLLCSYGTPPDSPGNLLSFPRFFGPGEFDPSVDVYAMKSHESAPKKEVYFMAIIDILTPYDAKKKAAHAAKTVKHGGIALCTRPRCSPEALFPMDLKLLSPNTDPTQRSISPPPPHRLAATQWVQAGARESKEQGHGGSETGTAPRGPAQAGVQHSVQTLGQRLPDTQAPPGCRLSGRGSST
ncbi:phosphatidylinositol 5-phosphate 4-kinase type-2 beta isoform X2 [Leopardus geoffroyi]|nr:phosphatidylinositol 5-phosphate 4-kinase type-2 beta isoform X2 [Leopardus geoffroyi]XP_045344594.1 phosphatidylinositol 5-phosphate 4-kinase type-2 beta isoform X2 [Leopardus geoffroyi]